MPPRRAAPEGVTSRGGPVRCCWGRAGAGGVGRGLGGGCELERPRCEGGGGEGGAAGV